MLLGWVITTVSSSATSPLWRDILLSRWQKPPPPLPCTRPIYAATEALIGGPSFLQLHVCVRHEGMRYDFVPLEPNRPSTALALLTGGGVDGVLRCRRVQPRAQPTRWVLLGHTSRRSEEMAAFAQQHCSVLTLSSNNCWTFARALLDYALDESH
uniref:Uncharacterized protein n=1 Tax=Haptolina ericina TaxID=156174 RepID=A0A7S3ER21_9EUKA